MRQLLTIAGGSALLSYGAWHVFGFDNVYQATYGWIALSAPLIATTFGALSYKRGDLRLAQGITLTTLGSGGLMTWWWIYSLMHRPDWMRDNPIMLMLAAIACAGAMVHFRSIGESQGHPWIWLGLAVTCFIISISLVIVM